MRKLLRIKRQCRYCQKEFERPQNVKRGIIFCSHECGSLWWSENIRGENHPGWVQRIKRNCKYCEKEFFIKESQTKRGRGQFCSKECDGKWRSKYRKGITRSPRVKIYCKYCGKEFERLKSDAFGITFCSQSCFGRWLSENKSGKNSHFWNRIKTTCKECGKDIETYPARIKKHNRAKFCSKKCLSKWQSKNICGENHPSWIDGRSFNPYCRKFNNNLKERVRERDGGVCQLCHISEKENGKKLDVHHIHYDKENCYPDLIYLYCRCNPKVNKRELKKYYEQYFMTILNNKELLFWVR